MGDVVQLTIIVKHIKTYMPEAYVAVVALPGRANVFAGLADQYWEFRHPFYWTFEKWDFTFDLAWSRPCCNYLTAPPTKVTECYYIELCPPLEIPLDPALYRYEIQPQPEAEAKAEAFVEKIKPFAFCHFHSEVSGEDKHLTAKEGGAVCDMLIDRGLVPLILVKGRQDRRADCLYLDTSTGLYDRWGDAQVLRSVIDRAAVAITIDSGPGHIAAATDTPTIVVWKKTVCPYCFDPAPNVLHLTPEGWPSLMFPEFREEALEAFASDYNVLTYDNLLDCLPTALNTLIDNSFAKGNFYVS